MKPGKSGVCGAAVGPDEIAKGGRHGEGDHEVMKRQKLFETAFEPPGGFLVLAGGAVSIAVGTEQIDGFAAAFALIEDGAHPFGTSVDDGTYDLKVVSGDAFGKRHQVIRSVLADYLRNGRKGRSRS